MSDKYQLVRKLIFLVLAVSLASCASRNEVPGAYMTPNKHAAQWISSGMALGIGGAGDGAGLTTGLLTSAASRFTVQHTPREALVKDLREQGVNVIARGDTLRIILSTDRFFEENKPYINPDEYRPLDYVTALLKEYGKSRILVTGYSDQTMVKRHAIALSEQRARAMVAYLWTHGISFTRLYAVGKGPANPIASNTTVLGSAANRRIEITVRAGC